MIRGIGSETNFVNLQKQIIMRVNQLLRELNIGLDSFNEELSNLGLPQLNLNTKLSEKDYTFIKDYFCSEEMKQLDNLKKKISEIYKNISEIRLSLKYFFLKTNKVPSEMGTFEKMQFFKCIIEKERKNVLKPNVEDYSEENFWILYNWFIDWNKMSKPEQIRITEEYWNNVIKEIEFKETDDSKKKQLFIYILNKEDNNVLKPNVKDYSEENFWTLYNWYIKWNNMSEEEQEKIIEDYWENEYDKIMPDNKKMHPTSIIDGESDIMSALSNGYGDHFGFD